MITAANANFVCFVKHLMLMIISLFSSSFIHMICCFYVFSRATETHQLKCALHDCNDRLHVWLEMIMTYITSLVYYHAILLLCTCSSGKLSFEKKGPHQILFWSESYLSLFASHQLDQTKAYHYVLMNLAYLHFWITHSVCLSIIFTPGGW